MTDPFVEFNTHARDLTNRVNFLAQAIFILAAGSLSASIAVFTGARNIKLSHNLANSLAISWWSLVLSVVLIASMLTLIILRDYFIAEKWRAALYDDKKEVNDKPGIADIAIISLGVLGMVSFIIGFLGLAYVATNIIGIT
jgi:hypothetical protein